MNVEDITKKTPVKNNKKVVYSEVLYGILVNKINYITKEKFFELEQKANEDNINVLLFYFLGLIYKKESIQKQILIKRDYKKADLFLKNSLDRGAIYASILYTILYVDNE